MHKKEFYRIRTKDGTYIMQGERGRPPVDDMVPADIEKSKEVVRGLTATYDERQIQTTCSLTPSNMKEQVQQTQEDYRGLLGKLELPEDEGEELYESMERGEMIIASDGSVREHGTFGYIISNKNRTSTIRGSGKMATPMGALTSQRAEYMGAMAITTIAKALWITWGNGTQSKKRIPVYIDNKGVVDRLTEGPVRKGIRHHLKSDTDIHQEILRIKDGLQIDWQWVKGHQDDTEEELSTEAQMNIEADEMAGKGGTLQSMKDDMFPTQNVVVTMAGRTISNTDMRDEIVEGRHGKALKEYMIQKEGWTENTYQLIDWELYQMYTSKKSIHTLTNTVKMMHGWQHVGKQKMQFNANTKEAQCLYCGRTEDQHHYLTCTDAEWKQKRGKIWHSLKERLRQLKTSNDIIAILGVVVAGSFAPDRIDIQNDTPLMDKLQNAIKEQQAIGWTNLVRGRIGKSWGSAQRVYLTSAMDIDRSDPRGEIKAFNRWRKHIVAALLRFGLDMWEARNTYLHGDTPTSKNMIRRKKAVERMIEIYAEGETTVPEPQRKLFKKPMTEREKLSTRAIEQWIELVQVARENQEEDQRTQPTLEDVWGNGQRTEEPPVRTAADKNRESLSAYQDIRKGALRPNPNVRKRKGGDAP